MKNIDVVIDCFSTDNIAMFNGDASEKLLNIEWN